MYESWQSERVREWRVEFDLVSFNCGSCSGSGNDSYSDIHIDIDKK